MEEKFKRKEREVQSKEENQQEKLAKDITCQTPAKMGLDKRQTNIKVR